MSNNNFTKCPFCDSLVEVDIPFARKNKRIFCGTCCKAFDIEVEDEVPEKPIKDNYDYWD